MEHRSLQPFWPSVLLLAACLAFPSSRAAAQTAGRPALIVLLLVDQLPEAALERLEPRFGPRGFRLLLDRGAWFTQAFYPQAATLTGPGHAAIATGALPAGHGIPSNEWYDAAADRSVYCVDDPAHHWIGGRETAESGTSPLNLESTTFGDEWLLATARQARVAAISLKDRGSIILGGKLGKAFWYDEAKGNFLSSTYYYPDGALPEWVNEFNRKRPSDAFFHRSWELLQPAASYGSAPDDRPFEKNQAGLGRTFPHLLGQGMEAPSDKFYKILMSSPPGNRLLLDLAQAAIDGEQLGRRGATDLLLLSITATDYCGHLFGPESLEYEDILLHLDRQLERFFIFLGARVGMDRTLLVLTSDHGAMPSPEHSKAMGLDAGRIDPAAILKTAEETLDAAFGPADWTAAFFNPGLFLKRQAVLKSGAPAEAIERAAARAIEKIPGVARALPRSALLEGRVDASQIGQAALATLHPDRSPDVFIIPRPYWYLYKDLDKYEGMHGTPYDFDAHVPIVLCGPGIAPGRHDRRVSPADIAPTICRRLGIGAPPASTGRLLEEIFRREPAPPAAAPPAPAPSPGAGPRPEAIRLYSFKPLPPLEGGGGCSMPVALAGPGRMPSPEPAAVPLREGGFSGLSRVRSPDGRSWSADELWTITDRGPNMLLDGRCVDDGGMDFVFGSGSLFFPCPGYNQAIYRVRRLESGAVELVERIGLKRAGQPINGLPSSAAERRTPERAYSSAAARPSKAAILEPAEAGYDFEGLAEDRSPSGEPRFWACDEYGPCILLFNRSGDLLEEYAPGARPGGDGTPERPALRPLPAVLRQRMQNRGFEGLAATQAHVVALLQSPLDPQGGASGEPGSGNPSARIHRLVRLDKKTGEAEMLAYEHIPDPERRGIPHGEVKIGDLAAAGADGKEFLVIEHAGKAFTHLYRIAITDRATRLDPAAGARYEAGALPYAPVEKTLIADLTQDFLTLPVAGKPEGLAILDARTVLIGFDNDFGFAFEAGEIYALPENVAAGFLVEVTLRR